MFNLLILNHPCSFMVYYYGSIRHSKKSYWKTGGKDEERITILTNVKTPSLKFYHGFDSLDILHDIFSLKFRFSSFLLSENDVANKDLFSTDDFLRRNYVFMRRSHTLTLRSSFSCNTENSKPRNITNEEFSKGNA